MCACTSHGCVCTYTYLLTHKPMYLYACTADVYLVHRYTYLHFFVAWVKIQIVTYSHNAFHSTLSAVRNEKKHVPSLLNTLRNKTLSLQLWHYFSPLLLCNGSPGLAFLSDNFHRDLFYCPFPRAHHMLCSCKAESTYSLMLQNTGLPSNSSYPQTCDMASPLAWVLALVEPGHEIIQLITAQETAWWHFGQCFSRLNWLSVMSIDYQNKGSNKSTWQRGGCTKRVRRKGWQQATRSLVSP